MSDFLIDYIKVVSGLEVKEGRRNLKLVRKGVDWLLSIAVCRLALGRELLVILGNVRERIGFEVIF